MLSLPNELEEALREIPSYSAELGLDLSFKRDRFKWLIASILFAKRISSRIAKRAFTAMMEKGLTEPRAILEAGWDAIVRALDEGGYVRYDFSTATNLIESVKLLVERYGGDIDNVEAQASDERDLESRLMEFRGFGPVAVNIFLRELRGVWSKAKPKPSSRALDVASRLGLDRGLVEKYESQLVRVFIEYCKPRRCKSCPLSKHCSSKLA
ncbi:MAG: hypothetical protein N3H31_06870 [Candidatus Nezhaarchaeota archaeon]|nr:hypothetical protein [Candidatus Nezhaarchaeota archaeon]